MLARRRLTSLQVLDTPRLIEYSLLSALMRFSMGLKMDSDDVAGMTALERNCSKQVSVVNDIYSWEKELRASQSGDHEGSVLCTAVKILADGTSLSIAGSKRVLWYMAREWENAHDEMVAMKVAEGCSQAAKDYMKGLEYQMSGNELWSRFTPRYHKLD